MEKTARVIGSDDIVRIGTTDEYKYFRVFHRSNENDIGSEKKFYASPSYVPGYDKWSLEPGMQKVIKDWDQRRKKYI